MPLPDFAELFRDADSARQGVSVAVAGAADETVLTALAEAAQRGWVRPILVGPAIGIRETANACGADISGMPLVDSSEPGPAAVAEVRAGRAQLLMKGQIETPALIKAALHAELGLRTGRVLCQVVLMEIPRDKRVFLLADTGISIQPGLDQKIDILRSVVGVAHGLGVSRPLVAVMSASEKVNDALPDTVEAAEITRRIQGGEIPDCDVQGPLSFDLAWAADAGAKKKLGGTVVGAADAMLFPNLLSANLTVKAIMYTADCRFGGVVCGASCPIVFMSRADTARTRLRSLALAIRIPR